MRRRLPLLCTAALLVVAGLALRLGPRRIGAGHLSLAVHHSGGGLLWGGMIYALVAAGRPPRWGIAACLMASAVIIAAVEGSRLLHGPTLDVFRATLAGQLLLGRGFAISNIAVDALGAVLVAAATVPLVRRGTVESRKPRRS